MGWTSGLPKITETWGADAFETTCRGSYISGPVMAAYMRLKDHLSKTLRSSQMQVHVIIPLVPENRMFIPWFLTGKNFKKM